MTKKINKLLILSTIVLLTSVFIVLPKATQAAPEVVFTNPGNGQTGISLDSNISFAFSELMNHSTLNASTIHVSGFGARPISAASINSYNIGGATTCIFDPISNFIAGETVTATVTTGAQNEADDPLSSDYSFNFTVKSDVTLPEPPTNLVAQDTSNDHGGSISLSWQASASSDASRYIIYRSSSSAGPYGKIEVIGNVTSYIDSSVEDNIYYYYKVRTQDLSSNLGGYSNTAKASAKENIPPSKITGVKAVSSDERVVLSWKNPSNSDLAGVRILRRTDRYPTSIYDGQVVYKEKSTSYEDTGLANNTTYYYTLYAYDTSDNYASGVRVSSVPKAEAEEDEEDKETPPAKEKTPTEEIPKEDMPIPAPSPAPHTPTPTPAPTPSDDPVPSTPSGRVAGEVTAVLEEDTEESAEEEPIEEEPVEEKLEEEEIVDEAPTEEEGRLLDKARATLINFFKPTSLPITVIIILSAVGIILYLIFGKRKLIGR